MRHFFAMALMGGLAMAFIMAATPEAAPYVQAVDNGVREIAVKAVHDGDTLTADVLMGSLGRTDFWARGVRLRLKDVRAYELAADAAKQDPAERETAIVQREALAKALFDNAALPVTAHLTKQTFDRYEAVVFTRQGCVNDLMRTYPQGGR